MRLRLYKGAALQAAIAGDRLRPAVLEPGIHGGRGYYNERGHWEYGDPVARPIREGRAGGFDRIIQGQVARRTAVARALRPHLEAYERTGRPLELHRVRRPM